MTRAEMIDHLNIAIDTFDDDSPGPGDTERGALRRLRLVRDILARDRQAEAAPSGEAGA